MKKLKWLAIALLALAAVLAVAREPLFNWVTTQRIDQTLQRAQTSLLSDGELHVILCGTAAALPDPERAGPCTAVIANGEFILIDAGPASWRAVDLLNLPVSKLSAVLVTHLHSDHIGDLGEAITQSWIAGRTQPLEVYGPAGIDGVMAGFAQVYSHDRGYRVAHHQQEFMPTEGDSAKATVLPTPEGDNAVLVFERNGVKVTAFRVEHEPVDIALGYRIEYGGRSVVISGDTKKSASVIHNAKGADLLLHEALAFHLTSRASARAKELGLNRVSKLITDVNDYHASPVQAAEVAAEAQVKKLVLTHIFPQLPNPLAKRLFMQGTKDAFNGPIVLGEDGMRFDFAPLK